jgi:hypothetical protein
LLRALLASAFSLISGAALAQSNGSNAGTPFTPALTLVSHTAGTSLGGLQSVSIMQSGKSGIWDNLWISSQSGAVTPMTFYIFDTAPAANACVEAQAFALSAADTAKLMVVPFVLTPAVIGFGTTVTFAQQIQTASVRNQDAKPTNLVYICIVANSTITPASASDLVGKISAAMD